MAKMLGVLVISTLTALASPEQVKSAAVQLNDTVAKADTQALIPVASRILKVDKAIAEKVLMQQSLSVGDLAFAALISEKTGKTIQVVLSENSGRNWAEALGKSKVSSEEAVQYLDNMNTEFAFAALDLPRKKLKR